MVIPHFLADSDCELLCQQLLRDGGREATVNLKAEATQVAPLVRKTLQFKIENALTEKLQNEFENLICELTGFFHVGIASIEDLAYLHYRAGDFFLPHTDSSEDRDETSMYKRRQLSAILFLNTQTREGVPGGFTGGDLLLSVFPQQPKMAVPYHPVRGELVVFRSSLVHEVKPVLTGDRFSAVCWYLA